MAQPHLGAPVHRPLLLAPPRRPVRGGRPSRGPALPGRVVVAAAEGARTNHQQQVGAPSGGTTRSLCPLLHALAPLPLHSHLQPLMGLWVWRAGGSRRGRHAGGAGDAHLAAARGRGGERTQRGVEWGGVG